MTLEGDSLQASCNSTRGFHESSDSPRAKADLIQPSEDLSAAVSFQIPAGFCIPGDSLESSFQEGPGLLDSSSVLFRATYRVGLQPQIFVVLTLGLLEKSSVLSMLSALFFSSIGSGDVGGLLLFCFVFME